MRRPSVTAISVLGTATIPVADERLSDVPQNSVVAYAASMSAPTDAALMLRYRDGDLAAFDALYRRHNDALYRYLLRLSGHAATAEDVYQEVWSRIVKARRTYRPTAKFTTYLYRIAHNCFIDEVRRNRKHKLGAAVEVNEIADPAPSPETDTERATFRTRLLRALDALPLAQRDVFLLYEEAGLSLEDIAVTVGVNRETAKSRLRYAQNKLRKALAERTPPAAAARRSSRT